MIYESKVIIAAVQENFGIDISLRTRRREIVDARQAVFVAMRVMGSTTQIADCFEMDHSTVIYSTRQHEHKYKVKAKDRLKHYDLYCAVYDFTSTLIREKKFDQYNAIMNVREELERHKIIVDDLRLMLTEIEKDNTNLASQVKELNKYKIAFSQLRKRLNESA